MWFYCLLAAYSWLICQWGVIHAAVLGRVPLTQLPPLLLLLCILCNLECVFASPDIPQLSPIPVSPQSLALSGNSTRVLILSWLFCGGWMLEPRWSLLARGLSLSLQLPKSCFLFTNLPGMDCLGLSNITVHWNLLPFPAWGTWGETALFPRQCPESWWPGPLQFWAYLTLVTAFHRSCGLLLPEVFRRLWAVQGKEGPFSLQIGGRQVATLVEGEAWGAGRRKPISEWAFNL